MKIVITFCFVLGTLFFPAENVLAQQFPKMDASPMDLAMARPDRNTPPLARVIYSRPQKKGREVFGDLVPFGEVWRTGANEATELTLYVPMTIGGKNLSAGTYTLYTVPGEDKWDVIINSDTNVWGSYSYKKDKDLVRIQVPKRTAAAPTESLSMVFRPETSGTTLMIGWDTTYIEVPFKKQ